VKFRASDRFGDPVEAVGPEKQRRVRRAAEGFLARHPELAGLDIVLEVAAVRSGGVERIKLVH
jgi:Holliday junction resolvase-like predicted endonuclease